MKVFSLALLVLLISFSSLSLAATESLASLYANPGPYQVKQELGVWEDAIWRHTDLLRSICSTVPEFKGALVMSPSARGEAPEKQFGNMLMPFFHLTGTDDASPLGFFTPEDRITPFKLINEQDQKAQAWLQQGGIADELATGDYFRFKPGPSRAQ
jgi:hypothetical protein